jgi:hypothetical protein
VADLSVRFGILGVNVVKGLVFVVRGVLQTLTQQGIYEGNEIAGDENEVVIEDADEIEQRVIAGNDASGLNARDVGLRKAHQIAELSLAEGLLAARGQEGLSQLGRKGSGAILHIIFYMAITAIYFIAYRTIEFSL